MDVPMQWVLKSYQGLENRNRPLRVWGVGYSLVPGNKGEGVMRSCWDIFCILQLFNFFFLFCNFEFFVRPGSQDKWKHPYHSEQTTGTLKPFQGLTILGIWKFCFVYVFISFNFYTDIFRDLSNFFHSLSPPPTWKWILLAKEGGKYYSNILRGLGFFMKKKSNELRWRKCSHLKPTWIPLSHLYCLPKFLLKKPLKQLYYHHKDALSEE